MASSVRSRRSGPRPSVVLTWLARSLVLFVVAVIVAFATWQRTPMVVGAAASALLVLVGSVWHSLLPARATQVLLELGAGDEEERPCVPLSLHQSQGDSALAARARLACGLGNAGGGHRLCAAPSPGSHRTSLGRLRGLLVRAWLGAHA